MVTERITFQRRGATNQASGQQSENWADIYTIGAKLRRIAYSKTSTRDREVQYELLEATIPFSRMSIALNSGNSGLINNVRYDIDEVDINTKWRKEVIVFLVQRNQK